MRQKSLLSEIVASIHFQEVMAELKVTEASVRNWIKTGNLRQVAPYQICSDSYVDFKNNVVGTYKLNKRANKLHADQTDHALIGDSVLEKIALIYGERGKGRGDKLSLKYESSLGGSHKNSEGIFYTPQYIASELLSLVGAVDEKTTFCDPCCGTGNFLIAALEIGIKPENIYGFDTDKTAVEIAKARIFEKTGLMCDNIHAQDFLEYVSSETHALYDLVFTNPPWGKKFPPEKKAYYADSYNEGIKVDSSAIFSLACMKVLNSHGYLGLLLPEAFFNVAAYRSIRRRFLNYDIHSLIDYGKAFDGLQTRAQAMVLTNKKEGSKQQILCRFEHGQYERNKKDFEENPAFIYNLYTSDDDAAIIRHVYSFPHVTLEKKAKWALGIVTGNNKKFIESSHREGYIPVYKGSDIKKNEFKEPTHFIPNDFSLYQQVAPIELYQAKEKIAYRFINSNLVFSYDDQQRFFLNSANMLILNENAGVSAKQLSFLLNTELFNWIFGKIFRTHKILRSDLEKLPIFKGFFENGGDCCEESFYQYLGVERKNGTFRIKK